MARKIYFMEPRILIDVLLVLASIINSLLIFSAIDISILNMLLSILICSFLPGWVLTRWLNLRVSLLESLVLSFPLSAGITSILFTSLYLAHADFRYIFGVTYLLTSLILLIRVVTLKKDKLIVFLNITLQYIVESLALMIIIFLIGVILIIIYPRMAYLPGEDIVTHYYKSIMLIENFKNYNLATIWFNQLLASIYSLSEVSYGLYQSSTAFMSIMLIIAFYIMSKAYLNSIHRYLPILSTVIFTFSAGFGFLNVAFKYLSSKVMLSNYRALYDIIAVSYWDIPSGGALALLIWFRPITVGFIILFCLLFLLKTDNMGKFSYIFVASFLVLVLGLVHLSEMIIFSILILSLSIIYPDIELRIKESAISVTIGSLFSIPFFNMYNALGMKYYNIVGSYIVFPFILSVLSLLFLYRPRCLSLTRYLNKACHKITAFLLIYFGLAVVYWLLSSDKLLYIIQISKVYLAVPWIMYPVLLGINGILGLTAIQLLMKKKVGNPLVIFIIFIFLLIVIGKATSYLRLMGFWVPYNERRMLPYIHSALSVLSAFSLYVLYEKLKARNIRKIVSVWSILLVVILGSISSMASVLFWNVYLDRYQLNEDEKMLVSILDQNVDANSYLLGFSHRSLTISRFSRIQSVIFRQRHFIWPALSPDVVLSSLDVNRPIVIFLSKEDIQKLDLDYDVSYVRHLLNIGKNIFDGLSGRITLLANLTSPKKGSDIIIVIPNTVDEDSIDPLYYIYDILSYGGLEYDSVLIYDIFRLKKANTLILPNEEVLFDLNGYSEYISLWDKKIIIMNVNNNSDTVYSILKYPYKIIGELNLGGSIPYIFNIYLNKSEVLFVDLIPIIRLYQNGIITNRDIYSIFREVIDILSIQSKEVLELSFLSYEGLSFRELRVGGYINLSATSGFIISPDRHEIYLRINDKSLYYGDIRYILFLDLSSIIIKGSGLMSNAGYGRYLNFTVLNPIVTVNGSTARVLIVKSDYSMEMLQGQSIIITADKLTTILNGVNLNLRGDIILKNVYPQNAIVNRYPFLKVVDGGDITFKGELSGRVLFSDVYTFLYDIVIDGLPPPPYDDFIGMIIVMPITLTIFIIYIIWIKKRWNIFNIVGKKER